MTERELFDAIRDLDEAYCQDVLTEQKAASGKEIWFRVSAIAAVAAVFAVSVGALGWFIVSMQKQQNVSAPVGQTGSEPESQEVSELVTELAEESAESSETEPVWVQAEPAFSPLELHENTPPTYSEAEEVQLMEEARTRFESSGYAVIDTKPYIAKFIEPWGDSAAYQAHFAELNTLEYKSYLYHMMLNSVDYYSTAQGDFTYDSPVGTPCYVRFQTDMNTGYAYEAKSADSREALLDGSAADIFRFYTEPKGSWGGSPALYSVMPDGTCQFTCLAEDYELAFRDNDRYYIRGDGIPCAANRTDLTNLQLANAALFPQQTALKYLRDFETWTVTNVETVQGGNGNSFDCAVLTGTTPAGESARGDSFCMYADIRTGILFRFEAYSGGELTDLLQLNTLELDAAIEVQRFDAAGLTEIQPFDPIQQPDGSLTRQTP